jgi:hypothetical protein
MPIHDEKNGSLRLEEKSLEKLDEDSRIDASSRRHKVKLAAGAICRNHVQMESLAGCRHHRSLSALVCEHPWSAWLQ